MSRLVKLATGDEYTHACIAFNPELKPTYTFGLKKLSSSAWKDEDSGLCVMNPTNSFYKAFMK